MLKRNLRVLVCGPSNISVDNIVERLAPHRVPLVRLGHPARLLPSVVAHSLDVLTQTSEAGVIVRDVRVEMDAKQASIKKTKSGRERRAIYADIKELRKEYRERERKCVSDLVGGSKVVLATLHGAGGYQLRQQEFDVVVIDEASQALEAQCWVPLLSARKAVCAGDHLQLPPTIKSTNVKSKSKPASKGNKDTKGTKDTKDIEDTTDIQDTTSISGFKLETTLFDRLLALHGPSIKRMLTTQYRMHEKIMRFPSDELYDSKLVAASAVAARLLRDLPYEVRDCDDTIEPLVFIDTQGGDFPEVNEEDAAADEAQKAKLATRHGESKSNPMEALLVGQQVRTLVEAGVRPDDIAVVTPYNAQVCCDSSPADALCLSTLGHVAMSPYHRVALTAVATSWHLSTRKADSCKNNNRSHCSPRSRRHSPALSSAASTASRGARRRPSSSASCAATPRARSASWARGAGSTVRASPDHSPEIDEGTDLACSVGHCAAAWRQDG